MIKISVLIVSYNTKEHLKACIDSVLAERSEDIAIEVIVVDNASSDGSTTFIKENYPVVQLIENSDNLGFGKANNQAYQASTGDYIFLLNPDALAKPGALMALIDAYRILSDCAIAAPKLVNPDGSVQSSCLNLPSIGRAVREYFFGKVGLYTKFEPNSSEPIAVEAVAAAALLINRDVITKLGALFDEKFFHYYEDLDLCRRIKHIGLKVYYVPTAVVIHHHGAAAAKTGNWAYEQNQRSAKMYFGSFRYALITFILKYGQKWQKLLKLSKR